MIKHHILSALAVCLLAGTGVRAQEDNTLLWQVSGNGLESPSYIFGTIHLGCPEDVKLSPGAMAALGKSEQLVLELDMDDPNMMTEMQTYSVNPGMANFSEKMSEEDRATVDAFFKKHYNMGLEQLGVMKPFGLLSMMYMKAIDCPAPAGFETLLVEHAAGQSWDVEGLETVAEQFAVFDTRIPEEDQIGWLVEYASDEEAMKQEMVDMMDSYKSQDLDKLMATFTESEQYRDLEEPLLYERNENWIDDMIRFASAKPTFFGVGAAHLGEDRGVLELLRKQGYTVTPLDNTME